MRVSNPLYRALDSDGKEVFRFRSQPGNAARARAIREMAILKLDTWTLEHRAFSGWREIYKHELKKDES